MYLSSPLKNISVYSCFKKYVPQHSCVSLKIFAFIHALLLLTSKFESLPRLAVILCSFVQPVVDAFDSRLLVSPAVFHTLDFTCIKVWFPSVKPEGSLL